MQATAPRPRVLETSTSLPPGLRHSPSATARPFSSVLTAPSAERRPPVRHSARTVAARTADGDAGSRATVKAATLPACDRRGAVRLSGIRAAMVRLRHSTLRRTAHGLMVATFEDSRRRRGVTGDEPTTQRERRT
ncbi:hypothetical protein GUJ93_ZPchr0003g16695 [Zizania palustris]|uniref:Uncharacterized protein n=1 Tax=Zizania palustris TaxID=103762 RepID=A0A8J5S107_ZIZPA|nr:hypothetical protein GUJ93_ZPchr0003g16695 [Zizania palustris]